MAQEALVCIIDDDDAIRESLRLLLYASNLHSVSYPSADAFLDEEWVAPVIAPHEQGQ